MTEGLWNFYEAALACFDVVPIEVYLVACAAYYFVMRAGQMWMVTRPAYDLHRPVFVWNLFMGILSAAGAAMLLGSLAPFSPWFKVCAVNEVMNHRVTWVILVFNLTKPLEWVDTIFLVLRKRPVNVLHWFHHLLTALYCLHSTIYSSRSDTTGAQFATMNLVVHAVMYMYYALAMTEWRPVVTKYARFITYMQVLQMAAGFLVVVRSCLMCPLTLERNWHGMLLAGAMYSIYLVLFSRLLWRRYFMGLRERKIKRR